MPNVPFSVGQAVWAIALACLTTAYSYSRSSSGPSPDANAAEVLRAEADMKRIRFDFEIVTKAGRRMLNVRWKNPTSSGFLLDTEFDLRQRKPGRAAESV